MDRDDLSPGHHVASVTHPDRDCDFQCRPQRPPEGHLHDRASHLLAAEALHLEYRVHNLVNAADALTPEVMWDTAPPRMPIARPASV
jgi:hypothetical protein